MTKMTEAHRRTISEGQKRKWAERKAAERAEQFAKFDPPNNQAGLVLQVQASLAEVIDQITEDELLAELARRMG